MHKKFLRTSVLGIATASAFGLCINPASLSKPMTDEDRFTAPRTQTQFVELMYHARDQDRAGNRAYSTFSQNLTDEEFEQIVTSIAPQAKVMKTTDLCLGLITILCCAACVVGAPFAIGWVMNALFPLDLPSGP
jgi:hypothetical protein